jgi:outer membrane receptor protein involved in Fe transport
MKTRINTRRRALLTSAAAPVIALALWAGPAGAQEAAARSFAIAPQPLADALLQLSRQADIDIVAAAHLTRGRTAPQVSGEMPTDQAMAMLLAGSGLQAVPSTSGYVLARASDPQSGSAAGGGAEVEALIVTAQKREEDIQDVPIAISAFSQEDLTRSQVAGGPDLMTQVPNMTFTKTNFSSYSIQLRGIGTQAISATTDPAVAVAFNNTPFVRNHFFEQEFYDLQRVEVLRGPQGTLYGRNATAGVVNVISQKPKFAYEAKLSGDVANYKSTRLEGMVNAPLVEDKVALRLAGAWTKREGFVTNEVTGNPIDGRDLWSTRASLRFTPTDAIDVNLIWEHFEENDDRLRSGKQLCKTHEVTDVGGFTTTHDQLLQDKGQGGFLFNGVQGTFSQGCAPSSLYSTDSFQTPNGIALPYYLPLSAVFLPAALEDPYASRGQSHDLRVIESTVDPEYKAKGDVLELQANIDLSDTLSLSSETSWASDFIFSTQDFNRFSTASGAWATHRPNGESYGLLERGILQPGPNGFGEFCDPQIGCADRLVAVDLSTAKSRQFSQELRLASDYDGPFNFSLGANFLRYDTEDKYYVFINSLSLISAISPNGNFGDSPPQYVGGVTDNMNCMRHGIVAPDPNSGQPILRCTYLDPNPIGSLNDLGHNYFLSRNPYKLISYAVFGEAYYNLADNLKVTAGLRWTVDKKEAPLIPSWVLASETIGYPVAEVVEQEWREPTGRLTVDWKPELPFTDETLLYASYAHGYKAGGANPPTYGKAIYSGGAAAEILIHQSAVKPKVFDPEFVDAFELGAKNTLLDGKVTLNLAAFYYDYKDYQISQIVDRSASNLNFDAEVWGLELEADWRAAENLRLGLKLGYENTKVRDGEKAIDIMDRTAGQRGWVVVRPFPSIPSNCILPTWLFLGNVPGASAPDRVTGNPVLVNLGGASGGNPGGCELAYLYGVDPGIDGLATATGAGKGAAVINYTQWSTDPLDYPGWTAGPITDRTYPGWDPNADYGHNHGEGFFKDLSGNELPNAPNITATITADYTIPLPNDWLATLHTDLYYQSEAWTRIFNMEGYDKLKAYTNVNLAAIFTNEAQGWHVMAYVKNVLDRDSITGAFLNSDDTGLTTNVFLTEPRLYGLRVTKEFAGGPWWTGADPSSTGPFPLTVEIGGQVQRHDAPSEPVTPSFIDEFEPALQPTGLSDRDLDWGDGRELRVAYRPSGGNWTIGAGIRFGRTNNDTGRFHAEVEGDSGCAFAGYLAYLCPYNPELYYLEGVNWSDASARNREEHTVIDFEIGRDVGLGGIRNSTVFAGLRHAEFQSTTQAWMRGVPDWDIPDGWHPASGSQPASSHMYEATLDASREFSGVGPILTWEASLPVLGGESGKLNVDWAIGGGVLFGKQETSISGSEYVGYFHGNYLKFPGYIEPVSDVPVTGQRSRNVTVPLVDLSLGLSYDVGRVKIGAGYRWERYFDVLDVGDDEAKDADRTIDGPYFKIAVGFGG